MKPVEEAKPVTPKWAAMIAQIFGEIPVECPKCGTTIDFKRFVFDKVIILKFFPFIGRAPPKIVIQHDIPDDGIRYVRCNDGTAEADFSQLGPETNEDFDQSQNW